MEEKMEVSAVGTLVAEEETKHQSVDILKKENDFNFSFNFTFYSIHSECNIIGT